MFSFLLLIYAYIVMDLYHHPSIAYDLQFGKNCCEDLNISRPLLHMGRKQGKGLSPRNDFSREKNDFSKVIY